MGPDVALPTYGAIAATAEDPFAPGGVLSSMSALGSFVTVPAGSYASGSPFGLIVVGRLWSEGALLAHARACETATRHRRPPTL